MRTDVPVVPLSRAVTFRGGGTPSKRNASYWGGPIPWVSPKDMKSDLVESSQDTITGAAVAGSAVKMIPEGATLIVVRSGILARTIPVAVAACELTVNQDLKALIPGEAIDSRYLNYFMRSAEQYLLSRVTRGATVHKLDSDVLKTLHVPLPRKEEQKRIVAILDEAFAGIATAVANTEKNLANARELFESYLNAVVSRGGEGWRRTKLGLEIDLQTGFAFKSKGYTKDVDGIRLLRGDNIIPGGIRWQDHKKWARDDAEAYSKYQLAAGDVVLAMDRTWIKSGLKYAQLNDLDLPCLLVQRVARLRAGPRLNSDFLRCLIGSASFTNYVLSIQTGLGVPHISGPQISEFEFFMPPVDEQAAIALSLDDLGSSVGRLESNYETKYAALCELKQSLLQKAFSGELTATPQDEIETALA